MKTLKKVSVLLVVALVAVLFTLPTFAAETSYKTSLEITAGITQRSQEDIVEERRETGKSYISIAYEADKLQEYKDEEVKMITDRVNADVEDDKISQDEADDVINNLKEEQKGYEEYAKNDIERSSSVSSSRYSSDDSYSSRGYGRHMNGGRHMGYADTDGTDEFTHCHDRY